MGERPTPDAPHPGKRRPPRAPSCRPHNAQSQLARARAVGLVTGPHARTLSTHSQWVVGPRRTPQRTGGRGWESARPRTPHAQARGAPPGRPPAAPTARRPARKSARVGVGDGSPRPHPQQPHPVGSGPRQRASKDERSGMGERCIPDAPHPGKKRAPRAPSCRPHSTQSQLARARAVGLVTGPHATHPPHPQPVGRGPGRRPQRTGGRGWESARTRTPHAQPRGVRPGRPRAAPTKRAKPARKSARCGIGDGSPRMHPPHPQQVGSGPRQHAPKDERSGVGDLPTPDAPDTGKRRPPRAPSCRPQSAQS